MSQAKDIPEIPILYWLLYRARNNLKWGTWFRGYENSVPMPEGTPEKLVLAKMRQMIKKGLVNGCGCGCRGDYEITDKGLWFIITH
jgi:hypothetical protein